MKSFSCCIMVSIGLLFQSCGSDDRYDHDKGYEDAWNGANEPGYFSSEKFRAGYQQGLEDAAAYDDGYYDGRNRKKAKYPKDPDYMDGFKDGYKNRKY